MWKECVLDATMGCRDGAFVFCPITGDLGGVFKIITGLNYLSSTPPEGQKFMGVVHDEGQQAVEDFCEKHKESLAKF